jgi:hypothetical protein
MAIQPLLKLTTLTEITKITRLPTLGAFAPIAMHKQIPIKVKTEAKGVTTDVKDGAKEKPCRSKLVYFPSGTL